MSLVAADAGPPAVPRSQLSHARVLLTLVRRELWEHRVLWIAPLVVVLIQALFALTMPTLVPAGSFSVNIRIDGLPAFADMPPVAHQRLMLALFGMAHWITSWPLYLTVTLVLSFYLCDCLYAERRDRSILFWKSLPVSDLSTVGAKALLGLVLVPLATWGVAALSDLLFSGLWLLRAQLWGVPLLLPWNTVGWLKVQGLMGIGAVYAILWYAPVGALMLLVSAWARRYVFLWLLLPPIVLLMAEWQQGTAYVWDLLSSRAVGLLGAPPVAAAIHQASLSDPHVRLMSLVELYDSLPTAFIFTNIHLWLGVLAAGAFLWLAAWVRRHRDDS